MKSRMIIKNGYVYDPINKINGEKMDIYIENGKIVEEFTGNSAEIINAEGKTVMPGGVDIHSHIAGKLNSARVFRPEDHRTDPVPKTSVTRSGVGYSLPSTFVTGYRYSAMGYTTVFEPAVTPLEAKHAHEELIDTPMLDKGIFVCVGNNYFVLKYIKEGEYEKLKHFIAWLLKTVKGYSLKVVNPGGQETWKWGKNVNNLDDKVKGYDITPRDIVTNLTKVNEELNFPHTNHVHCNNLGSPGNYEVTLETMKAVEGIKPKKGRKNVLHIAHSQFNSYAGENWGNFSSGAAEIAEYLNKHGHITTCIGQVIFTNTTTITSDGPWQYRLYLLTKNKWAGADTELETSGGIVPYIFKKKNPVNTIQWAIGLELMLLTKEPWKVFIGTDHPNGGPFTFYPLIIAWLMSRKAREEMIQKVHKVVHSRTQLASIDREYSLFEVAVCTRAGTAKALGLSEKGHLGVGADADVAIYNLNPEKLDRGNYNEIIKAFSRAAYTIKDGEVVVKDGEVVKEVYGKTYWTNFQYTEDEELREDLEKVFRDYYTVSLSNFEVPLTYLPNNKPIKIEVK